MIFPCTKCGLCCQNISSIPELKDYDLGTGICKYFDSITNGCEIYENRPLICRVDKMFDLKYHKFFSKISSIKAFIDFFSVSSERKKKISETFVIIERFTQSIIPSLS